MNTSRKALLGFCLLGIVGFVPPVSAQDSPRRAITHIAGDLYRFQNNFHYSVFLVTPEGVIVTDPINADAARWLKAQITERFGQPIKYLVYSHDHVDHSAGGEVFDDTAIVVAHENAKVAIIGERRPTAVPELTFTDRLSIELGGRTVELSYVGRGHSDNMIVMRFPAERALFAVDFIPVKSLAWKNMTDAYIPDWIEAIRRVEAMDFDILVPGHGALGTPADARAFRGYMEALHAEVLAAAREDRTLEQMQQTIRLDAYRDWHNYEAHLPLNIEGMYKQVVLHRRGN